jgi:hypothetical protein
MSERYDYPWEVQNDVAEYIRNNVNLNEWRGRRDDLEENLNDKLWIEDSVTGNASGSYYCNTWKAEEAISHNWDLLREALEEFGDSGDALERGAEYCDVTIRCYVLGAAISAALDELEEELEELDDEELAADIGKGA